MLSGFKKFILRGNVVDLAVAVVIGGAFSKIVDALVKDIISPLLGLIGGQPDFSNIQLTVNKNNFLIGDFINALISFLIIAAAIYFLIVLPLNKLIEFSRRKQTPEDPTTKKCPYCLAEIPKEATRCQFCTSELVKVVKLHPRR